jgi:hypothetical protein
MTARTLKRRRLPQPLRLLLLGALLSCAVTPPAPAGQCWGCLHRQCAYGFETGAFGCTEIAAECSLISRLTGTCIASFCTVHGVCVRGEAPRLPEPVRPESPEDDPKREDGEGLDASR